MDDDDLAAMLEQPLVLTEGEQHRERVELYSKQIAALEERILREAERHRSDDFRRLNTLPGVSTILALTILYEAGPVTRFASAKEFSSYCRVVPGVYQSGSVRRRRGAQSKQGNAYLKWAFNQAALHAVRNYAVVKSYFDRHLAAHVGPAGKVVVYNTVAHKIAVAAYHMLRDKTDYKERLLFKV
jgi:transposase